MTSHEKLRHQSQGPDTGGAMDDAQLIRALMRGHVFDDPHHARRAEERARELARRFNSGPVRWGWWLPLGQLLIGQRAR